MSEHEEFSAKEIASLLRWQMVFRGIDAILGLCVQGFVAILFFATIIYLAT